MNKAAETIALDELWSGLSRAIQAAHRIVLSTHENPDGDGLGSQLAFHEYLLALGKESRILNYSRTPAIYHFLDPNGWIEQYDAGRDQDWLAGADMAIVFDLGSFHRTRTVSEDLVKFQIPVYGIDHHPQENGRRGGVHLYHSLILDHQAPSTGTLIWEYFQKYMDPQLTLSMAEALYTALATDTGTFRYANTSAQAHEMAAALINIGVKPNHIQRMVYEQRERSQVRLLGVLFSNLEFSEDGQVSWCVLTQAAMLKVSATTEDSDGFSEFIRSVKGVEISVLITELESDKSKISLRSKGRFAVNGFAGNYGGGGHALAAGAVIDKSYAEVVAELIPQLEQAVTGKSSREEL